jgi:hypothetical protein
MEHIDLTELNDIEESCLAIPLPGPDPLGVLCGLVCVGGGCGGGCVGGACGGIC